MVFSRIRGLEGQNWLARFLISGDTLTSGLFPKLPIITKIIQDTPISPILPTSHWLSGLSTSWGTHAGPVRHTRSRSIHNLRRSAQVPAPPLRPDPARAIDRGWLLGAADQPAGAKPAPARPGDHHRPVSAGAPGRGRARHRHPAAGAGRRGAPRGCSRPRPTTVQRPALF